MIDGQLPVKLKNEKSCDGCPACVLNTQPSVYYYCSATGNHIRHEPTLLFRARWCPIKIDPAVMGESSGKGK